MKSISSHIKGRMFSVLKKTLPLVICAAAVAAPAYAAPTKWEQNKVDTEDTKIVAKDAEVEIRTASGSIVVVSAKPVQIKVYTILGQLISRENLPAGRSQLNVQAHGVYIIKTGDLTCKVAL